MDGTRTIQVAPDRISINERSDALFSEDLNELALDIADSIVKHQVEVSGLGINSQAVFTQPKSGVTGTAFCLHFVRADQLEGIVNASGVTGLSTLVYLRDGVQYTLKIEPHSASNGANLFTSVNGHQNVAQLSELQGKVAVIPQTRRHVTDLTDRLQQLFEEM